MRRLSQQSISHAIQNALKPITIQEAAKSFVTNTSITELRSKVNKLSEDISLSQKDRDSLYKDIQGCKRQIDATKDLINALQNIQNADRNQANKNLQKLEEAQKKLSSLNKEINEIKEPLRVENAKLYSEIEPLWRDIQLNMKNRAVVTVLFDIENDHKVYAADIGSLMQILNYRQASKYPSASYSTETIKQQIQNNTTVIQELDIVQSLLAQATNPSDSQRQSLQTGLSVLNHCYDSAIWRLNHSARGNLILWQDEGQTNYHKAFMYSQGALSEGYVRLAFSQNKLMQLSSLTWKQAFSSFMEASMKSDVAPGIFKNDIGEKETGLKTVINNCSYDIEIAVKQFNASEKGFKQFQNFVQAFSQGALGNDVQFEQEFRQLVQNNKQYGKLIQDGGEIAAKQIVDLINDVSSYNNEIRTGYQSRPPLPLTK